MTLDLTFAAIAVILAVIVRVLVRRRTLRGSGPLPDVPDASSSATPIEALGLTMPYSSLDPFAPPKDFRTGTTGDGAPESR